MSLDDDARAELAALEAVHRRRGMRVVDGPMGPRVRVDGREVVNLASNDYLGLAGDPRLVEAAQRALAESGVGAGASRLIVGNHREHVALEAALADWLQRDGVRTFSSGYAANVGVLSALLGPEDLVVSDALDHASIIDGCRLSRTRVIVVPHGDVHAVEAALTSHRGRRRLVVSESLFSMDGDLADVEALAAIARRHDAALMIDEAHALGVFGPEGRGWCAERGVVPDLVVGTFGKALGSAGAFVATSAAVAEWLWNRARSFVFSTGPAPAIAAATRAAITIVRGADSARATLEGHARRLRAAMPAIGGDARSPIAPWVVGDDRRAMAISTELLAAGVFAQGIRPPTVPVGTARLRMSLMATHTSADLDFVIEALRNAVRQ